MKRLFTLILVGVLSVIMSVALVGCHETEPWEYSNVEWYTDNQTIQFTTTVSSENSGTINVNGNIMPITMLWGPSLSFRIIDANKDDGKTPVEDITLLQGKVEYDSESATLIIEEDNVFDYQFSSIVLKRRNLTTNENNESKFIEPTYAG